MDAGLNRLPSRGKTEFDWRLTQNVYLIKDGTLFLLYRRTDFEKMTKRAFGYANEINGHYEIFGTYYRDLGATQMYISDSEGNLIEIGSFNE